MHMTTQKTHRTDEAEQMTITEIAAAIIAKADELGLAATVTACTAGRVGIFADRKADALEAKRALGAYLVELLADTDRKVRHNRHRGALVWRTETDGIACGLRVDTTDAETDAACMGHHKIMRRSR